jgi:hypothetical protein
VEFTGENIKNIPWQDSILDTIRDSPAMFLGVKSLSALWYFLHGYQMARWRLGQQHREIPDRFADWVGYRLHLDGDRSGDWHNAILECVRDQASAVDRFYELRDECVKREPHLVATIRDNHREIKVGRYDAQGNVVWGTELLPKSLQVIVYTDDPGFFLSSDEKSFSDNGRFFPAFWGWNQFASDRFEIHDEQVWKRLETENARYKRNLIKRRARSQKKLADGS